MNILRQILCLKIITIIALATFFISTMSIREAQAGHSVTCPCRFVSATFIAKRQARATPPTGGVFDITSCNLSNGTVRALGTTSGNDPDCRLDFEVEDEGAGEFVCSCEFQCHPFSGLEPSSELDFGDNIGFALRFAAEDITQAEFDACRQQVIFISQFIFNQPCT